ncbi:MAG: hypothetical protein LUC83_07465 [Clostridiales bacterium]|nr:hypothetical protein [Clostridiales bacterium]
MTSNDMQNNPAFQNLSPEKLQFLISFMGQEKSNNARDMMSLLMAFSGKAKKQGILFSAEETDFIIGHLTESMSPGERQRANMIINMLKQKNSAPKTE